MSARRSRPLPATQAERLIKANAVVATVALIMLSAASLLADRMGWVAILLSGTGAGRMSRLLLPGAIAVPLLTALVVHGEADHNYLSKGDLTIVIAVNMLCITGLILAGGALMMRGEAERQRLAAIVESSTDAIYARSADGTLLSWNRGAEHLYGYTEAEAIGASATMLLPEDEAARAGTYRAGHCIVCGVGVVNRTEKKP